MDWKSLDPNSAMVGANLLLPKSMVNVPIIKNALTFEYMDGRDGSILNILRLYRAGEHHIEVPRAFSPPGLLDGINVLRIPYQFKKIRFPARITPRDDVQRESMGALDNAGDSGGILQLACGLGKTVIALAAAFRRGYPILVVVHTTVLMEQWKERIMEFSRLRESDIGVIQGNKADWKKPITIAMIHTLSQRAATWPVEMLTWFGTVIYDEVHHVAAPTFSQAAPLFVGTRFGLSATPERPDGMDAVFRYHIGNILHTHMEQPLRPKFLFVRTDIRAPVPNYPLMDRAGNISVPKVKSYLANHRERTNIIERLIKDAMNKGRKVAVLSHINALLYALDERIHTAGLCIGEVKQHLRPEIIRTSNPLLMAAQIGKEGLDRSDLDTMILATPFSDTNMLIQAMGRILRVHPGKKQPIVMYIEDAFIDPCRGMAHKLRRWLRSEGYDQSTITISREDV